jgi:hypothetical protein
MMLSMAVCGLATRWNFGFVLLVPLRTIAESGIVLLPIVSTRASQSRPISSGCSDDADRRPLRVGRVAELRPVHNLHTHALGLLPVHRRNA